ARYPETAMNARDHAKPDADDSSRRACGEIAWHREDVGAPLSAVTRDTTSADALVDGADPLPPDVALRPAFVVNPNGYAIDDFTHFQHEGFVRAAFLGLLRREPDPSGLDHYVTRLEGGD